MTPPYSQERASADVHTQVCLVLKPPHSHSHNGTVFGETSVANSLFLLILIKFQGVLEKALTCSVLFLTSLT